MGDAGIRAQGRSATNKYGYSDPSYVVDEEAARSSCSA